jgi:hypothetical protein
MLPFDRIFLTGNHLFATNDITVLVCMSRYLCMDVTQHLGGHNIAYVLRRNYSLFNTIFVCVYTQGIDAIDRFG